MNKKKHYLIYQITNNINQKFYIGKHETYNIDDDYFGSGKYLKHAIKKHGIENFTKTILFELQNREEMNLLEKAVVTPEFCAREDTYNINVGGDGGWDYCNKTGKRVSIENQKYDIHALTIKAAQTRKEWPEERKQQFHEKMSASIKLHNMLNNPVWLGRNHREETKKKMHESHIGKHNGKLNSQFGTMWICNDETHESKKNFKIRTNSYWLEKRKIL